MNMWQLAHHEHLYAIRQRSFKDWYIKDVNESSATNIVIWVPQLATARIWTSEEEVEEFKYQFLKNRHCDIIWIK